jgi:hypothetical protein
MFGMAKKPRTRANWIMWICLWGLVLVVGVVDVVHAGQAVRFLSLLQIAVVSMALLREVKELLEEPNRE